MRRLLSGVAAAALLASAITAISEPASAASSGSITDLVPTAKVLDARKRHTEFFSVTFQAEAGENRFVATELVVSDAKKTAPDELFLGVTLTCTSPSGKSIQAEGGRNVWPAGSDFMIPVGMLHTADVAGTYTCSADVMMCDPGNCSAPTGVGKVSIVTRAQQPKDYSFLYVSAALPSWAQSKQVPSTGDVAVQSGTSSTFTWGFDVTSAGAAPVRVGAIVSMTNCIERNYPTACAKAKKTATQGSANVLIKLTATQVATQRGVKCAMAKATASTGAGKESISWQQHHAVFSTYVPDFVLSTKPGCGSSVEVEATVTVGKGNAVVVESGTKAKWSSMLYAIPGDTFTQP